MALSKRKRKIEARNKAEGKKLMITVLVVTFVLLVLLYIIYARSVG